MTWTAVMLLLMASASVCRAANIDIISRMDRSLMPYSGSARNPFRRYRYPIYTKRTFPDDDDSQDDIDNDLNKRFLRGVNLGPLSLRDRKSYGLSTPYDIPMTPYALKVMDKLYRSGRRKRTPDLYDLKQIYKVYEAGRKKSSDADDVDGDDWQKRGGDFTHDVWGMARVADVGKRSPVTSYYDLLDMAKLAKAGKRSGTDTYGLWRLAQMEAAGKRSLSHYDLMSLAKIADAGKRSPQHFLGPHYTQGMDRLYGKRSVEEEEEEEDRDGGGVEDGEDRVDLLSKQKRGFDDYFGWDRKKKSVGDDTMVNDYLNTMQKEVIGGKSTKRSTSDAMGMVLKGDEHDDED